MTNNDSIEELRRLLQARLQEWRLREGQPQYRPKPVVAITEEPGCGGEAIAEKLSAELGFHLYSWELVEQIAKDADVSTRLVASLEAHPRSELEDWLAELEGDFNLTLQAYVGSLKRVLFAIAVHGNAVIMGRGSNFFLAPDKKIGLCLVAPLDSRIKNAMEELGLSESDARKHITKLEKEHQRLVKKYFQADMRDSTHYHLVVNTAVVKPEIIVQIVKIMVQT
ncbi:MAG: cytidylate kinase-like family protein [Verrucomicrobiota bacterium]|jgi:cytidylate kinase